MDWLAGKKTYVVCAVAIAYALSQHFIADPPTLDLNATLQMVFAALGAAGLRNGISAK